MCSKWCLDPQITEAYLTIGVPGGLCGLRTMRLQVSMEQSAFGIETILLGLTPLLSKLLWIKRTERLYH